MKNTILTGDVREQLRLIPDEHVHCVITSPPYWGLRDYGTASWEGGEEGCDHRTSPKRRGFREGLSEQGLSSWSTREEYSVSSVCSQCGAKRIDSQLGLEATPEEYVQNMVDVFREIRRVLRRDGVCWLNLGDSYANNGPGTWGSSDKSTLTTGSRNGAWAPGKTVGTVPSKVSGLKPKDLVGIPWRVAFALQADGWWLRSDVIWSKPNPMPESVTDRPTKSHEYIFLLTKSANYYYDADAIRESAIHEGRIVKATGLLSKNGQSPDETNDRRTAVGFTNHDTIVAGRNARTVWEIATQAYSEAHFATFPEKLARRCILAGTSEHGCCAECGAPWERVVEKTYRSRIILTGSEDGRYEQGRNRNVTRMGDGVDVNTTGWRPTCTHDAPVKPCLVLDPFFGSGTTGLVAAKAGRDWIGVELNPTYVAMAEHRLRFVKERLL